MKTIALTVALIAAVTPLYAADARLANAKTVYVEPIDPLEGDRPVAACIVQRLPNALPLQVVDSKEDADVVLRVKARISGDAKRQLFGALGLVDLALMAPDGKKLWDGFRSESRDTSVLPPTQADVACLLADTGIELLRKELKKARDSK